jgi:FAD/FMN-containing dehydrogenase/Fe-S oxidoreductase
VTTIENFILKELKEQLEGEVHYDQLSKVIYATDASIYREEPLAVVYPKSHKDIVRLVQFTNKHQLSLIPRSGGTSLSGQCVGNGIVVDVSRYMNEIKDFDKEALTVTVGPGVVRDELNQFLEPRGCFFAPITSTANRATIGGMLGNNSCGTNSIVYGDTRQYVHSLKGVLSDGSTIEIKDLSAQDFEAKCQLQNLEGRIYRQLRDMLQDEEEAASIRASFPKKNVHRRNTGYALDALLDMVPFSEKGTTFNLAKLVAGSEGTLLFISEVTIGLCPLPPSENLVLIVQFDTIGGAMKGVVPIMKHQPFACELMDKVILDCTRDNLKYSKIRSHFKGDPAGSLMVEFRADDMRTAEAQAENLIRELKEKGHGYEYSIVKGKETKQLWGLRSAGLGLLANIPGDAKAVACIEDTAVAIEHLADYMQDFADMMRSYGQKAVYYAHAGAGEIHLRPILNLKEVEGQDLLYKISKASAELVKKYGGSLSGEHGDGRVRAPFIPLVLGEDNYNRFVAIKETWDPRNIFNPHKIVHPKKIDEDLRYKAGQDTPHFDTLFDFSEVGGILRLAEKCNGSGDCRKLPLSGGTMCPSYQATRREKDTTRARANALRTFLSEPVKKNPFDNDELKEVLDLCLSCKGCTSECPSNVDMTTLKSEWQYQYYKEKGFPLRSRLFANIDTLNRLGSKLSGFSNFILTNSLTSFLVKRFMGVASERSLPEIEKVSFYQWARLQKKQASYSRETKVMLFCDEFTNFNDVEIGKKAYLLLDHLGYDVQVVKHDESGRAALSKGVLEKARKHAERNVSLFSSYLNDENVAILGIEPSAILSFRDEYPKLVRGDLKNKARGLSEKTFLIEEFLASEVRAFKLHSEVFDDVKRNILVHGHCHQKALSNMEDVFTTLSLPRNHTVKILQTGCCGMAGSFGYEKEHYDLSQQIAELTLFPQLRSKKEEEIVVASGTSCRHQIKDGLKLTSFHAIEVLYEALKKS